MVAVAIGTSLQAAATDLDKETTKDSEMDKKIEFKEYQKIFEILGIIINFVGLVLMMFTALYVIKLTKW